MVLPQLEEDHQMLKEDILLTDFNNLFSFDILLSFAKLYKTKYYIKT